LISRRSLAVLFLMALRAVLGEEAVELGYAEPKERRVPVIFSQNESEFFVGTFGPIGAKTLDDYVRSIISSSSRTSAPCG